MKYLSIISVLLLTLISCKKTTTVTGIISDRGTGLPLEGVKVYFGANKILSRGAVDVIDKAEVVTGLDGEYTVEVEGKGIDYIFIRLTKSGYIRAYKTVDIGTSEVYDRPLNPLDSYLKVRIQNESGASSVNYRLKGTPYEDLEAVGPNGGYKFSVPFGESVDHLINVPGGGYIQVYWDTLSVAQPHHLDSIYCPRKDTTLYLIKY